MTEPQGQPDHESAAAPEPATPAEPVQPVAADRSAEPPAAEPGRKAPAKKTPGKKAPDKAAKKAPGKKAPAKKAPAKKAPPAIPSPSPAATNGSGQLTDAARETAAQAKSMVDTARNPVSPSPSRRVPVRPVAASVLGLFGLLLIRRWLRAHRED